MFINGPTVKLKIAVAVTSDGKCQVWRDEFPKGHPMSLFLGHITPPKTIAYHYVYVDVPLPVQRGIPVWRGHVKETAWSIPAIPTFKRRK